jgi:hypothetical protein
VTDSGSRRVSEDLTAQLPPKNAALTVLPRGIGSPGRDATRDDAPPVDNPAPKPFHAPSGTRAVDGRSEPIELPTVAPAGASFPLPTLPAPTAPTPPPVAPRPVEQPKLERPKQVEYTPPKPLRVARPPLPSSVAAVVYGKTRVQVKVRIDQNGNVIAAEPVAADAKGRLLGEIVARAARYWQFEAARRDGVASADELVVNVDYEAGGK